MHNTQASEVGGTRTTQIRQRPKIHLLVMPRQHSKPPHDPQLISPIIESGIHEFHTRFSQAQSENTGPIDNRAYQMRDFYPIDHDVHIIIFGQQLPTTTI